MKNYLISLSNKFIIFEIILDKLRFIFNVCVLNYSFLKENATCKEKLLTSACGYEAGALAAHMTLISPKGHTKRTKCHAPNDIELKCE